MRECFFRLYGITHKYGKIILGRQALSSCRIISFPRSNMTHERKSLTSLWRRFIEESEINGKSDFAGFHYAGYVLERNEWCLESWIWTNAAIIRMECNDNGDIERAKKLGDLLAYNQHESGGWIVRNDYDSKGPIPMLAPNDSAYIANNAFLTLYKVTRESKYLEIARKCADWIMSTCRSDGMVYTGYNVRDEKWEKDNIIVDVGFTAGLFANLYIITEESIYKNYLTKFIQRYIELFYDPVFKAFSTSIDKNNRRQGGFFGRGQAWALEGLIPSYVVINDINIRSTIESLIDRLLSLQNKDGSWSYNLSRRLMGNDCKGVSVIGKALADWYAVTKDNRLVVAIQKAYDWCSKHTLSSGEGAGGIYSFCMEGAIVKDLYSSCAFVYASAYAIEINKFLNEHHAKNNNSDN